jgi:hypothetical protein
MTRVELITKYPKIFNPTIGQPYGMNWQVPDAWIPVIDILCGAIQKHIDTFSRWSKEKEDWVKPQQVTCVQMKEKFGGLRFYINGGDEQVEGMISMAEHMCYNMCQHCGTRENLGVTGGWITICCKSCSEESTNWKPINSPKDESKIF